MVEPAVALAFNAVERSACCWKARARCFCGQASNQIVKSVTQPRGHKWRSRGEIDTTHTARGT